MLGSLLPCNVLELLGIHPLPLPAPQHEALVAEAPRAYPDVLYKLGLSHLGRQEFGLARQRLAEAVARKPELIKARLALAGVCDLLAAHAEAIEHLDAALAATPNDAESDDEPVAPADGPTRYALLCAAGFCLERLGEWEAAAVRYTRALVQRPTDLFADYRLAAVYLAHNRLEAAVHHHQAILEQMPQEQAVRISLAHLLQHLGRHQEAVWEYEKALCLEPDSWELQVELAEELARMGNTLEAIEHLRLLVDRQPHFPDMRLRLANLYSERGDDDSAVGEYATALSLHPEYLDCHIAFGRHELRMGRMHAALDHFQKAIAINDQKIEAYVGLAVALHRTGEAGRARETLEGVASMSGNTDVLLAHLGLLELQAEAALSADAAFDPCQQEATQTVEREVQREWLEQQAGRYETVLAAHPSWTDVRVRHGMLLKLLGQYEPAIQQLEKATTENPGYAEAWVQLGLARQEAGDADGAMKAFETAVQVRPEWADLHYRLGLIYCGQMEFDLALEQLEIATSLNKGNPDFQRQLWVAIEGMQMHGRRPAQDAGDPIVPISEEAE